MMMHEACEIYRRELDAWARDAEAELGDLAMASVQAGLDGWQAGWQWKSQYLQDAVFRRELFELLLPERPPELKQAEVLKMVLEREDAMKTWLCHRPLEQVLQTTYDQAFVIGVMMSLVSAAGCDIDTLAAAAASIRRKSRVKAVPSAASSAFAGAQRQTR